MRHPLLLGTGMVRPLRQCRERALEPHRALAGPLRLRRCDGRGPGPVGRSLRGWQTRRTTLEPPTPARPMRGSLDTTPWGTGSGSASSGRTRETRSSAPFRILRVVCSCAADSVIRARPSATLGSRAMTAPGTSCGCAGFRWVPPIPRRMMSARRGRRGVPQRVHEHLPGWTAARGGYGCFRRTLRRCWKRDLDANPRNSSGRPVRIRGSHRFGRSLRSRSVYGEYRRELP